MQLLVKFLICHSACLEALGFFQVCRGQNFFLHHDSHQELKLLGSRSFEQLEERAGLAEGLFGPENSELDTWRIVQTVRSSSKESTTREALSNALSIPLAESKCLFAKEKDSVSPPCNNCQPVGGVIYIYTYIDMQAKHFRQTQSVLCSCFF